MKQLLYLSIFFFTCSCTDFFKSDKNILTDKEKALYAMGHQIAKRLKTFKLTEAEAELVLYGVKDSLRTNSKENGDAYLAFLSPFIQERSLSNAAKAKKAGKAYLKKKLEEGFKQTESGLAYKITREGNENRANISDSVMVTYEASFINGKTLDSSKNKKMTIPLSATVKAWREGLKMIGERGEIELIAPSHLAYGDQGSYPQVPGGSTLHFKIQLFKIEKVQ